MSTPTQMTTIAWVTKYSMRDFAGAKQRGDVEAMVRATSYSSNESMGKGKDAWTRVGTATISVAYEGEDKVIHNAVKALRSQQRAVRAEAEAEATHIERQIQQLLAITNEVRS